MQNNELESIWADGIPNKIEDKDKIEPKGILQMCIRFVLENILNKEEYKITSVQDNINAYPNIELIYNESKYAIAVVPCIFPYFIRNNDELRIGFAKASIEKNYIPVLCPVVICSVDEQRANNSIYLKGDLFKFANLGQKILNTEPHQEITPDNLDFKL